MYAEQAMKKVRKFYFSDRKNDDIFLIFTQFCIFFIGLQSFTFSILGLLFFYSDFLNTFVHIMTIDYLNIFD